MQCAILNHHYPLSRKKIFLRSPYWEYWKFLQKSRDLCLSSDCSVERLVTWVALARPLAAVNHTSPPMIFLSHTHAQILASKLWKSISTVEIKLYTLSATPCRNSLYILCDFSNSCNLSQIFPYSIFLYQISHIHNGYEFVFQWASREDYAWNRLWEDWRSR